MEKIRIGFAADHRGFKLKEALINEFKHRDNILEVVDCGTDNENSCDYPDYAKKLGDIVSNKIVDFGVAICGSGIGISIALNKIKGVYCAKCNSALEARYTRLDNDTNCISFSGDTALKDAILMVETFINTDFSKDERHQRRIEQIKKIESDYHD